MTTNISSPTHSIPSSFIGMVLGALCFGLISGADVTVKYLSDEYSIFQILMVATLFAYIPVVLFLWRTGALRALRPRHPRLTVLRSVLVAASAAAILWAVSRMPLADAYALVFTCPLIVTALAAPILKERVSLASWCAVLGGFIGVLVILRPGFQAVDLPHVMALVSAVLFAAGILVLRWMGDGERTGPLLLILLTTTVCMMAPLGLASFVPPEPQDLAVMALSGLCAGLAHICLVMAVRFAPASTVSPFQYTQILWGLLFGALVFGDQPEMVMLLGAGIVILSGLFLLWQESRRTA